MPEGYQKMGKLSLRGSRYVSTVSELHRLPSHAHSVSPQSINRKTPQMRALGIGFLKESCASVLPWWGHGDPGNRVVAFEASSVCGKLKRRPSSDCLVERFDHEVPWLENISSVREGHFICIWYRPLAFRLMSMSMIIFIVVVLSMYIEISAANE